ncbi:hypothetical protein [Klebsiella spallanzanii]|uniref:hypothetical protein n=1 Tax=Klebsiella spallanzanii TaxID=2587528 RepID=UPI0015D60678|nr:hypothetical protein [Klebsiella spallanzanii]MDM4205959.1 hypothetical protein [Klebsiella spallanzanii]
MDFLIYEKCPLSTIHLKTGILAIIVTIARFPHYKINRSSILWVSELNISNGHAFLIIKVMIITQNHLEDAKCDHHHIKRRFLFENAFMSSFRDVYFTACIATGTHLIFAVWWA